MVTYESASSTQPITVSLAEITVRVYPPDVAGSGTTNPAPGDYLVTEGDSFTITAYPGSIGNVDYRFAGFFYAPVAPNTENPWTFDVASMPKDAYGRVTVKPIFNAVPAIPTTLTISAPATVTKGVVFTTTGKLTRTDNGVGVGGQTVSLWYGPEVFLGSGVTASDGSYSISASINIAGAFLLSSYFGGVLGFAQSSAQMNIGSLAEGEINWVPIVGVSIAVPVVMYFVYKLVTRKKKQK